VAKAAGARPAKAKRAAKAKPAKPQTMQARIVVDLSPDTPTYYVNHMEIAVNKYELALWLARLPTKPGRAETALAEQTGEIVVEPEFQILISPTLLPRMVSALTEARKNYEAIYGPIREIAE
jgi:hypothetical protein